MSAPHHPTPEHNPQHDALQEALRHARPAADPQFQAELEARLLQQLQHPHPPLHAPQINKPRTNTEPVAMNGHQHTTAVSSSTTPLQVEERRRFPRIAALAAVLAVLLVGGFVLFVISGDDEPLQPAVIQPNDDSGPTATPRPTDIPLSERLAQTRAAITPTVTVMPAVTPRAETTAARPTGDPGVGVLPADVEAARVAAETCLRNSWAVRDCLRDLAHITYFVDADYARTIDLLQQLTQDEGSAYVYDYYLLGRSYFREGQCMSAVGHFQTALALIASGASTDVVGSGEIVAALADCDMRLPSQAPATLFPTPDDPATLIERATVALLDTDTAHALQLYARCLELDADNTICRAGLAEISFYGEDDYAQVVALLGGQLAGTDADVELLYILGVSYARLGDCDNAAATLRTGQARAAAAVGYVGERWLLALDACGLLTAEGEPLRLPDGSADFLTSFGSPAPLATAALSVLQQGQVQRAVDYLDACLVVDPRYSACLSARGRVAYLFERDNALAVEVLARALQTDPAAAEPYNYYLLGRAYTDLGDCPAAVAVLQDGQRLLQRNTIEATWRMLLVDESAFQSAIEACTPGPEPTTTPPATAATPTATAEPAEALSAETVPFSVHTETALAFVPGDRIDVWGFVPPYRLIGGPFGGDDCFAAVNNQETLTYGRLLQCFQPGNVLVAPNAAITGFGDTPDMPGGALVRLADGALVVETGLGAFAENAFITAGELSEREVVSLLWALNTGLVINVVSSAAP